MQLFLTGGTGFIGSHFLRVALDAGVDVRALRRPGSKPRIKLSRQPNWVEAELDQVAAASMEGCDTLVHLAATGVTGQPTWAECFTVNVEQSLKLWLRAAAAGIRRFVICGSCFEYGRSGERYEFIPVEAPLEPTAPYHASKAAASMAALGVAVDQKLSLTIVRPFHVFGEGEDARRFWSSLRHAASSGNDYPMTEGQQVRDFVEVGEVARQILSLAQIAPKGASTEIKHVGSGRPQTVREFAEHWWTYWGAVGRLQIGAMPYRPNEVMRYVPKL